MNAFSVCIYIYISCYDVQDIPISFVALSWGSFLKENRDLIKKCDFRRIAPVLVDAKVINHHEKELSKLNQDSLQENTNQFTDTILESLHYFKELLKLAKMLKDDQKDDNHQCLAEKVYDFVG